MCAAVGGHHHQADRVLKVIGSFTGIRPNVEETHTMARPDAVVANGYFVWVSVFQCRGF